MRINQLSADEFERSMAMIAEALENVAEGGVGKELLAEVAAGAGRQGDEKRAAEWGLEIIEKYLPRVLRENVGDAYLVLAAVDGQTLEEYKASFTPPKMAADVRALVASLKEDGDLRELFGSFFG